MQNDKMGRNSSNSGNSNESGSSSNDDSSSSGESEKYRKKLKKLKKKLKKEERRKEKMLKKKLKHDKKKLKKEKRKKLEEKKEPVENIETVPVPEKSLNIPIKLMEASKAMVPMTKEEWEKRQSVVRRVMDETTGRYRLIKGDGEVLEEIVSYEQHKKINRKATLADGNFFESQTLQKKPKK